MKIGDKVSVLDDDLCGIVTLIKDNLVTFETSEGFSYQYPKSQLVCLTDELTNNINLHFLKDKEPIGTVHPKLNPKKPPVFDLHIDKLLKNHRHLSPGQKLSIQLKEVESILNRFKRQHYRELVLIHGQGKGILRKEIEKILRHKGFEYTDASYRLYGDGAILVLK